MKKLRIVVLPILLTGVFVQCAKEEKEEIVIRPERMDVQVTVPEFQKGKSVLVQVTGSGFETERDVLSESVRNNVSREDGLYAVSDPETSGSAPDYVLKGQIAKTDGQFEIVTVLRDREGMVLSDQHYLEDETGLIQISEEIAARTIAALNPDAARMHTLKARSPRPDVIPLYFQSRALLSDQTHASTDQAIAGLKEVVRKDSSFVPAWISLANAYLQIYEQGWNRNLVWLRLAQQSAVRAVQLDSLQADAYQVMGRVHQLRGDALHAETNYRMALDIHPRLARSWAGLGQIFSQFGLYEPAIEAYGHAFAIQPNSAEFSLNYAMLLIGLKRYTEAQSVLERAIRLDPDSHALRTVLALTHYYLQEYQKASGALHAGLQDPEYRPLSHAVQAMILCKTGQFDAALGEVELEVKPAAGGNGSLMTAVAAVYALLGRDGLAVQWLEKAVHAGYREYPWIANDPNFSSLKGDARYQALMQQLKGLWEAQVKDYFEMQG